MICFTLQLYRRPKQRPKPPRPKAGATRVKEGLRFPMCPVHECHSLDFALTQPPSLEHRFDLHGVEVKVEAHCKECGALIEFIGARSNRDVEVELQPVRCTIEQRPAFDLNPSIRTRRW